MSEAADMPPLDPEETPEEPVEAPEDPETSEPPGEEPEEPEEAPEAEPVGLTPEAVEKNMERTEREGERHRKRLSEIWGDEEILDFQVCPACQPFAGMRPPLPWDEEQKQAVRAFIGDGAIENYEDDPDAGQCPRCKGKGKLMTGSLVRNQESRMCVTCQGAGWINTQTGGAPDASERIANATGQNGLQGGEQVPAVPPITINLAELQPPTPVE